MLADMQILAPADEEVLTREALDLVARLHRELNPRRRELLERRRERQGELDAGGLPRFRSDTKDVRDGIDAAISRGLAYAPYADLVWFETSTPDLDEAKEFAEAIHDRFPGKPLAYNCSPSFNWRKHLDDDQIASFQDTLGEWGYRFLFITLAGFHVLNASMFDLARGYAEEQMPAYVRLQQHEFELEEFGYTATRHQHEVGAGYFDHVTQAVAPDSETLALKGSTEEEQFTKEPA